MSRVRTGGILISRRDHNSSHLQRYLLQRKFRFSSKFVLNTSCIFWVNDYDTRFEISYQLKQHWLEKLTLEMRVCNLILFSELSSSRIEKGLSSTSEKSHCYRHHCWSMPGMLRALHSPICSTTVHIPHKIKWNAVQNKTQCNATQNTT